MGDATASDPDSRQKAWARRRARRLDDDSVVRWARLQRALCAVAILVVLLVVLDSVVRGRAVLGLIPVAWVGVSLFTVASVPFAVVVTLRHDPAPEPDLPTDGRTRWSRWARDVPALRGLDRVHRRAVGAIAVLLAAVALSGWVGGVVVQARGHQVSCEELEPGVDRRRCGSAADVDRYETGIQRFVAGGAGLLAAGFLPYAQATLDRDRTRRRPPPGRVRR